MDKKQRGNSFTSYNCFKNKRGQITLFIVVGLVIFSLVMGYLVLREKAVFGEFVIDEIIDVPGELRPIHNYITDVVYALAVEGLSVMGEQGGWISLEDSSLSGQAFSYHPDPTSSELLSLNSKVPYWYFMKSPNDCFDNCEFSMDGRPPLRSQSEEDSVRGGDDTSIEAQLDRYIELNLKDKLVFGFASLREQGYELEGVGDVNALTLVGEEDLAVSVNYKIKLDGPSGKGELSQYFVRVPLNLNEIYALSAEILKAEEDFQFLDNIFWNWINLYQGIENELPPASQFDVGGSTPHWFMRDVKSFIQDTILIPYVVGIQIQDTKNYEPKIIEGDENDNFYRAMNGILSMSEPRFLSKYYDLSVKMIYYPGWDIYVNVDPHEGELIRPTNLDNNLLGIMPISFQMHKFFYDISVPVMVIIKDEDAFNGEGYTFMFALESNIRSNMPLTPSSMGRPSFEAQEESKFSNPRHWLSGNITIEIIDNLGDPVEGVEVRYSCGPDVANMGMTKLEEGKAVLISKFPLCLEGLLGLSKEGYLGYDGLRLTTKIGEGAYISVQV